MYTLCIVVQTFQEEDVKPIADAWDLCYAGKNKTSNTGSRSDYNQKKHQTRAAVGGDDQTSEQLL